MPAEELYLCVVDASSGLPISDCHVQSNRQVVGVTNADGLFLVPSEYRKNKLRISHVGYYPIEVELSRFRHGRVMLSLNSQVYSINEVVVMDKKRRARYVKMGVTGRKRRDSKGALRNVFDRRLIGLYIPNDKPNCSWELQQVNLYISDNAIVPMAPFWLTIYEGEAEHIAPRECNRLYGPLLTHAAARGQYHSVNVQHAHIRMPKGGLFVVLQNNSTNEGHVFIKTYDTKRFEGDNKKMIKLNTGYKEKVHNDSNQYLYSTQEANGTAIGESWQYANRFFKWNGLVSNGEDGSTFGIDGNTVIWKRDTIHWDLFPKNHAVHHGNYMIYVVLKEIKK